MKKLLLGIAFALSLNLAQAQTIISSGGGCTTICTFTSVAIGGATIGSNALAVTGTSLFNNTVSIADGVNFQMSGNADYRLVFSTGSGATLLYGGNTNASFAAAGNIGIFTGSGQYWGWSSNVNPANAGADLTLYRDAANTLAQRNGTNAQRFNIDYSYTDGSNRQGGSFITGSTYFEIATNTVGTGADNLDLRLTPSGTGAVTSAANVSAVGLQTTATVVASLPTCNAGAQGLRRHVTDASTTTFASPVGASGSNVVPVMCDGTNWIVGSVIMKFIDWLFPKVASIQLSHTG